MSPTYHPDDNEDLEDQDHLVGDGRTPVSFSAGYWVTVSHGKGLQLDKTIDRIGMGSYQWTLLSLCGFGEFLQRSTSSCLFFYAGWMADNVCTHLNRINAGLSCYRCGYRQLQSYYLESNSITQVSRPLGYQYEMCQHAPVPDSYIGTVSSSMFAGMMIGALGWGTCKS